MHPIHPICAQLAGDMDGQTDPDRKPCHFRAFDAMRAPYRTVFNDGGPDSKNAQGAQDAQS